MPTKVSRDDDNRVVVDHQPGNMTRYLGVGVKLSSGPYEGDWIVSFPEWGSAYAVSEGRYLAHSYVAEKWGHRRTGGRLGDVDIGEMAKVIAMIVPGTRVQAVTDDHGELLA